MAAALHAERRRANSGVGTGGPMAPPTMSSTSHELVLQQQFYFVKNGFWFNILHRVAPPTFQLFLLHWLSAA